MKLRAVLTGVEEEDDEEEDMWEEEEEDRATLSEDEEEEVVLGKVFSRLFHAAWPLFTSSVFSLLSLVTGRWFGLVRTLPSQ